MYKTDERKCIVAVDDSGLVLKVLENILGEKYHYNAFSKGMRALKYLKTTTPDLIILDIDMPEIDGYEMLRMIREKEELKDVPVIFLTSNSDKSHVVAAVQQGANDYVVKPVDEKILLTKIQTIFHEKTGLTWDDIK